MIDPTDILLGTIVVVIIVCMSILLTRWLPYNVYYVNAGGCISIYTLSFLYIGIVYVD